MDMPIRREAVTNKLRETLRTAVAQVLADDILTSSCISCVHFKEKQGEICNLYKMRPPAKVIAFGCPSYMDNLDIPF